jgi:hypothetical protein
MHLNLKHLLLSSHIVTYTQWMLIISTLRLTTLIAV